MSLIASSTAGSLKDMPLEIEISILLLVLTITNGFEGIVEAIPPAASAAFIAELFSTALVALVATAWPIIPTPYVPFGSTNIAATTPSPA